MYPREMKIHGHPETCQSMFTGVLFIITKNWKQLNCLNDEWVNKLQCILQILEYYSAMKRKEPRIHTTQMNFGCIDTKWKKPDSRGYILYDSIKWHSGENKTRETKNISVVSRGWVLEEGGTDDDKVAQRNLGVRGDRTVLYLDNYMAVYVCQNSYNYTLQRANFNVCKLYPNKSDFKKNANTSSVFYCSKIHIT